MQQRRAIVIAVLAAAGASAATWYFVREDRALPPRDLDFPERPPVRSGDGGSFAVPSHLRPLLGDSGLDELPTLKRPIAALDIPLRTVPAQRLAIAGNRVAQLADEGFAVYALDTGKEMLREPMGKGRRAFAGPRGTLFAVGARATVRLLDDEKRAELHARVPLFPNSQALPDLQNRDRFWVSHAFDLTLYRYDVTESSGTMLRMGELAKAEGYDGKALTLLPNGAFLHTSAEGLVLLYPGGQRRALGDPPGGEPLRLHPARRLDRAWVVQGGDPGEGSAAPLVLRLVQFAGALRTVRMIELPANSYDVATSETAVAVVHYEPVDGGDPRFFLSVFAASGKKRFRTELPESASDAAGGASGWLAAVTRNRSVVLSADGKAAVVGGPDSIEVRDATSGDLRWSH